LDLDGDGRPERAVVGVYETTTGDIGRFLLILSHAKAGAPWTKKALFSLVDPNPFSAILIRGGAISWVGCFSCDDVCAVRRAGTEFRLICWPDKRSNRPLQPTSGGTIGVE
jgi:hypothetical protein